MSTNLPTISRAIHGPRHKLREMHWASQLAYWGEPIKWTRPQTDAEWRRTRRKQLEPVVDEICRAAWEAANGKSNAFARLSDCLADIAKRKKEWYSPVAQSLTAWRAENPKRALLVKQFAREHKCDPKTVRKYARLLQIPLRGTAGRPRT